MSTSFRPPLEPLAEAGLNALIDQDSWVIRRKHRIEVLAPGLVRHQITVDFVIPDYAYRDPTTGTEETYWLPLFTLPKAPGDLFRFDVTDHTGRTVALPTREENAAYSAAVSQLAAAQEILLTDVATENDPNGEYARYARGEILKELATIAKDPSQASQGIVLHRWKTRERKIVNPDAASAARREWRLAIRSLVWQSEHAAWLIESTAHSSLVALPARGAPGDRRIYKLSYDEILPDVTRITSMGLKKWCATISYLSGFRSMPITFVLPWVKARSFHFEAHVPDELEVVEAGISASALHRSTHPQHAHTYAETADERVQTPTVRVRLAREQYGPLAWGTAAVVAVLMILAYHHPDYLLVSQALPPAPNRPTPPPLVQVGISPAPSLLLLIPGLVASALARTVHPVARRLSTLARLCLVVTAAVAFATAVRLALISVDHPADAATLRQWFLPAAWASTAAAGILWLRWTCALLTPSFTRWLSRLKGRLKGLKGRLSQLKGRGDTNPPPETNPDRSAR